LQGGKITDPVVRESTATISDSAGNLLFYAQASKVWNRNHQVMPNGNGLLGGPSSTQGAFIIPKPGSDSLFYLFTTDQFQHNLAYGLRYSVISMCLNGGFGDIIAGQKNILLLDTVGEKMAATNHANGIDYWLVVHKHFSDAFYAYHVSSTGIIDTVVSHIGYVHVDPGLPGNVANAIGQMKISPDAGRLAYALSNQVPSVAELFDFNNATGVVSNCISLPPDNSEYGVSFSEDNSKLYFTTLGSRQVFQYDLSVNNAATIIASKTLVGTDPYWPTAGMQLGPDGKIYFAGAYDHMAVINNPNVAGPGCNIVFNAISLGHVCWYGITNFIDSYNYHNGLSGCDSVHNPLLIPESESTCFTIPGIFTPSNETLNVLDPTCVSNVRSFDCKIFNCLGQKVYATSDTRINWGGKNMSGKECASGAYYIVINYADNTEKNYQVASPIFLMR